MDIGKKIRRLRIQNDLTQEELADRAELSKGFISQLENDQSSPSISTLEDVLQCLGTTLQEFFSTEREEVQVVFRPEDYFTSDDAQSSARTTWIVPDAQKRRMESILFELEAGAESKMDKPHAGEEFGYVLTGQIQLKVGARSWTLNKGDCFNFEAIAEHGIKNAGAAPAKILWISSPPNF